MRYADSIQSKWWLLLAGSFALAAVDSHTISKRETDDNNSSGQQRLRGRISKVHLVQSNHLDVGFTGSITTVLNQYFNTYIPGAINTTEALRQRGGPEQLVFTTHAWILSLFLDCPAGRGLDCPDSPSVAAVEAALRAGSLALHAFPFNSELDMYDASLVEAGVQLAGALNHKYGRPAPTVLSQRDVPGMTQALVPVLSKLGVEAISIGCNGAAQPPGVPPIFRWRGTAGEHENTSVIALVHPGGYAELNQDGTCAPDCNHAAEYYTVGGSDEALVMAWNGDNQGPPSLADVLLTFNKTQQLFPNAVVVASTMDAFVRAVQPHAASLPVVDGEIADNWIYGVGSDPYKVAAMRAAARSRSKYLSTQSQTTEEAMQMLNFSRQLLKGGEHTWGTDTQYGNTTLTNDVWSNEALGLARLNRSSPFPVIEDMWREQRKWAVDYPLSALHGHPLHAILQQELAQLRPTTIDTSGYTRLSSEEATSKVL